MAMSQADWGPPWQRPVPATLHKLLQALPSPSLTRPTASAHSSNHHTSTPTSPGSGAGCSTAEHRNGHGSGKAADGRASCGPAGALPDASAAALLAGPLAASGGLSGHDLLLVAVQAAMAEEGWCLVGAEGQVQVVGWWRQLQLLLLHHHILAVRLTRFLVLHGCLEAAGGGGGQAGAGGTAAAGSRPAGSQQHAPLGPDQGRTVVLGGTSSRVVTLALDTVQELRQEAVVAALAGGQPVDAGVFRALQPLWVRLRDSLAAALTAASHAAAGLPPPLGLLTLPWEVKEQVLRLLQARDLAALGLVCTELRALAAEDRLWRPLFMAAFPAASSAQRQQGERQGFKWAFAVCAKVRPYACKVHDLDSTGMEAAARRRASQHRGVRLPQPLPMGPGGLFMPGRPVYPPGIIGGDYDRLPSLPGGMFSGPAWGVPPSGGFGGVGAGPAFLAPRRGGVQGPFNGYGQREL
ncbi:hypothetical protein V8C86DRAFT_3022249 [Haematococcus lacustris]